MAAMTPSRRWLRFGLWVLGAIVGSYFFAAGAAWFGYAGLSDSDIDGPLTTRSRIVWGGVGIAIALAGLALLVVSIVRATRLLRRPRQERLAGDS